MVGPERGGGLAMDVSPGLPARALLLPLLLASDVLRGSGFREATLRHRDATRGSCWERTTRHQTTLHRPARLGEAHSGKSQMMW